MTLDANMDDLLSALTDALLAGDDDVNAIVNQYNVPRSNVNTFLGLIRRLHLSLTGVQPSQKFVTTLKQDLLNGEKRGLVSRVRYLPARVQIAAGVVAVAGFMLLSRRRLLDLAAHSKKEVVAPQQ